MMTEPVHVFQIRRQPVQRYFFWTCTLLTALIGAFIFGYGALAAPVYALTSGPWLSRRQAEVLDYRLRKTHLFVNKGVFFIKRKTIPLDRITDIVLAQGPLLRYFDLWRLDIQTAGSGQRAAEAYLYGLTNPEEAKEQILTARDAIAIQSKQNPGF
jgi:putative membrane protein